MPSLAASRELHEKRNFIVAIDGIDRLYFSKCSELSVETAKIEYFEGGSLIPFKLPGRATVADITLERGVGTDVNFDTWCRQVSDLGLNGGFGAGQNPVGNTRNLTIMERDRTTLVSLRKYIVYGAWPTKYVAGEWDNGVDEVVIESLTLAIDRFQLLTPTPAAIRLAGV